MSVFPKENWCVCVHFSPFSPHVKCSIECQKRNASGSDNCCCLSVLMSFWSGGCPTAKPHLLCSQVSLVEKCDCSWKGELLRVVWLPGTWSSRNSRPLKITALKTEAENFQCDEKSCREMVKWAEHSRNITFIMWVLVNERLWGFIS